MLKISSVVFPAYRDLIDSDLLRTRLNLVQSIIFFSKGRFLTAKDIGSIERKLGSKMGGSKLYKGGSSVLFGWSFDFPNMGRIIIKPYYRRELSQLVIHYLTTLDCVRDIRNLDFSIDNTEYEISVPEVIGIARIENLSYSYPVILAREIEGEAIHARTKLVTKISSLIRDIARTGIICDPYPANWLVRSEGHIQKVYYIDLLSSNVLKNVHTRISELITQLEE